MNARRRRFLGWLLGLVVVLLAAGWFGARGGRAEVKMVFLRFTNEALTFPGCGMSGGPISLTQTVGRVAVTNTGSVSLRLEDFRAENLMHRNLYSFSIGTGGSGSSDDEVLEVLKPGESAVGFFWVMEDGVPSSYEVGFCRVGLRDRLSDLSSRIGWGYGANKFRPSPNTNDLLWVSTGWITNPPALR